MDDRIILEGMTFFGYHGTLPEERRLGQRFVVDLEIGLDLRTAGLSDELADTLDYGQVFEATRRIVEGEPMNLLEALAQRIADAVLAHGRVEWVRVRVRKPDVALKGVIAWSGVEITRGRKPSDASLGQRSE